MIPSRITVLLGALAQLGCASSGSPECVTRGRCTDAGSLVTAAWVQENRGGITVIDVRDSAAFEAGHVEGAIHLDVASLRAEVDGVEGQVAGADVVGEAIRGSGLEQAATVVAYGDGGGLNAARLLWTLEYYGHEDLRLLDGGWSGWDGDVAAGPATATASDYAPAEPNDRIRVEADWVLAHLDDPSVRIFDARSAQEYADSHVPGALNVDWHDNLDADGFMLGMDEVAGLYGDLPEDATLVVYCKSGTRAAMAYFALRWLGHEDVRLYDGSWNEWGSDPELPKE